MDGAGVEVTVTVGAGVGVAVGSVEGVGVGVTDGSDVKGTDLSFCVPLEDTSSGDTEIDEGDATDKTDDDPESKLGFTHNTPAKLSLK